MILGDLEAFKIETTSYKGDELVQMWLKPMKKIKPYKINKVFLSLQGCVIDIMKLKGNNVCQLPLMSKDRLAREERLSLTLKVYRQLARECTK